MARHSGLPQQATSSLPYGPMTSPYQADLLSQMAQKQYQGPGQATGARASSQNPKQALLTTVTTMTEALSFNLQPAQLF